MPAMQDNRTILIAGGAGYIGSHVALALQDAGIPAVVLDDLSTGVRESVPAGMTFVEGDCGDGLLLEEVIRRHRVGTVMHFAGSTVVPESVADPLRYYRNNTLNSLALIEACVRSGVGRFVFSSTAAVYGIAAQAMVTEDTVLAPINPYGSSKLMTEGMLRDSAAAYGLRYVALRYFNVAGADPAGRSGQSTPAATHLIKVAAQVVVGARNSIEVFGTDYPTPDGTCVRDYIHVCDLADAHVRALKHLESGGESATLNCGYGHGYSVKQVLDMVDEVCGRPLIRRLSGRRPGDPPALVADATRLRRLFDWQPRYAELRVIVETALAWEAKLAGKNPAPREAARG
jgi:UDP-glucose 4-epimerase